MPELKFLDQPWTEKRITGLVWGVVAPYLWGATEEMADQHVRYEDTGSSAYEMLCQAMDGGDYVGLLDAIQLEGRIALIEDDQEAAAVTLATLGWESWRIGAALSHRSHRTGEQLVKAGIRKMTR